MKSEMSVPKMLHNKSPWKHQKSTSLPLEDPIRISSEAGSRMKVS